MSLNMAAGSAACVSRLERLLAVQTTAAGPIVVTVWRKAPPARLVAYLDKDTGLPAEAREVELTDGRAVVDASRLFRRRGKLILKYWPQGPSDNGFTDSGAVGRSKIASVFKPLWWLGNEDGGLCWFAES